ncbi:hypothetical protein DAMNIGENAA_35980 [Desulforhabdus amnigena]|uniref:Uncharacterized protein n=1 Tax=Desulforhabdus amnigena TaxID=40218 RepID=A0A9W6LAL2_9BACT|nr:hypothetical protein DAMNIGENAA_35980 [Desulforhabdus amnigena]
MDENLFFREATLRLCSSLYIETALKRCYEYITSFIPVIQMSLSIMYFNLKILRFVDERRSWRPGWPRSQESMK